jgi:phage replication initiation protein
MNNITYTEGEIRPNAFLSVNAEDGLRPDDEQPQCEVRACGGSAEDDAPRLVIRGERFAEDNPSHGESFALMAGYKGKAKLVYTPIAKENGEPLAALTDYLNTTFPYNPTQENLIQLVQYFRLFLGEAFDSLHERKGGLHGYKISFNIGTTGGLLAYGGQRGTVLVSLPGSACALIADWQACYHLFHDILNARISRWDGAVDVFDGIPISR